MLERMQARTINSTGGATAWADEIEMEVLCRATRSHLLGETDPGLADLTQRLENWGRLLGTAMQNRVATLLNLGFRANGVGIPSQYQAFLDNYRTDTFGRNTRNLNTALAAVAALEQAGIEVVVFKGPTQQQRAYGDSFIKRVGDVDLLVDPRRYAQAVEVLMATHFVDPECASPWWRIFLGEQALRGRDGKATTVDLHHRLQQPGCPSPADTRRFLQRRQTTAVGSSQAPVLSAPDACLLASMSIVKAMVGREPAACYVADLVAGLRRLTDLEFAEFVAEARRQRLVDTVAVSLRCAQVLFGYSDARFTNEPPGVFASSSDRLIAQLVLTPWDPGVNWPKRRQILWDLCGHRVPVFAREAAWALGGQLCHLYVQAQRAKTGKAGDNRAPSATPA
jgi:hypothetical protein